MMCYNPVQLSQPVYQLVNGKIQQVDTRYLTVGCGKCLACVAQKNKEWAMRLSHESLYYNDGDNGMFLTLTYNKENVPSDYSLHVRELQLFYKRLRKQLDKLNIKIKHFSVGEYGRKRGRPHYHSIVLGISHRNKKHIDIVRSCWNKGYIYIGYVSNSSIQYCCKYMLKSQHTYLNRKDYYLKTGRERPFRIMSKGIGKRFCLSNVNNIIENLSINFADVSHSVPRSYIKWIEKLSDVSIDLRKKLKEKFHKLQAEKIYDIYKHYHVKPSRDLESLGEDFYNMEFHPDIRKIWYHRQTMKKHEYEIRYSRFLDNLDNKIVLTEEIA